MNLRDPNRRAFLDAGLGRGLVEMRSARRVDSRGRIAASRSGSEGYSALAAGYRLARGPADGRLGFAPLRYRREGREGGVFRRPYKLSTVRAALRR